MSEENVELVRAALDWVAQLDEGLVAVDGMSQYFAQDAITTFSGFMEEQTTLHGAEFLEWRGAWMEPYDDFLYEPVKIIDAGGNRVVVILHQRGKLRGGKEWVEMDYGLVYTVEKGLIARADFYATPEQALEAGGLSE